MRCRARVTIVEVGPRDGLQNEAAPVVDRRQDRVRRPPVAPRACRSSRCRRSSARSGCRRWRTRPRCSPASRGAPGVALHGARAEPRGPRARASRPASPRSPSSPPRPRRSAAGTSTRAIDESLATYRAVCDRALAARDARARRTSRRRSAARSRATSRRERVADVSRARCVDLGVVRGRRQRHDRRRASRARCRRCSTRSRARVPLERRRAALPRHARHGARQRARGAPISASRRSTRRPAASAAAPTRRARPATWRPRIWSTCWTASESRPASNLRRARRRRPPSSSRAIGHRLPSRYFRAVRT